MGMVLLQILLLSQALGRWVYGAEFHDFTMVQLAYFPERMSADIFGNATLDGTLTHSLKYHNGQFNVSQLFPLESSDLWEQRKESLLEYLNIFKDLVSIIARERKILYPLHVHCNTGCQLFANGSNSFYEVLLNGMEFLRFHASNHTWVPLENSARARYTCNKLNEFPQSTVSLQLFLQETCINLIKTHIEMKEASTGKQKGRVHAPLVLGISIGALALIGLAVCIFLCTGGKR
ncbi:Endothelial protein C receptor [Varanus komodoensis]|uniref:MHC class I-like antigen recognition-like domain-containing protein n=1 Tax=Varanus komodoensis TaxID=61221 RepID=A0A8D2JJS2_VARKO|nr:endothelial protein C receptor-like [Varanus komodoensis]KAF7254308.1 Endothelial protein C receptor [Varanus komodoensis]